MLELKPLVPNTERIVVREPHRPVAYDAKQRRLMVVALGMLLVALGFVLYRNRDFWFPDAQDQEAELEQPAQTVPSSTAAAQKAAVATVAKASSLVGKSKLHGPSTKTENAAAPASAATIPMGATATADRTVLPSLEVEVIAGDTHRTVHPGSNSVSLFSNNRYFPRATWAPALTPALNPSFSR